MEVEMQPTRSAFSLKRGLAAFGAAVAVASTVAFAPSPRDLPEVAPANAQGPSAEFAAVTQTVEAALVESGVPGAAVGVYGNGRAETAAFGRTAIDGGAPVTVETRFGNGSITKTYTATAIMRLVDDGKIDLDAPVRDYLPDLQLADPMVAEAVTVRQLLNHTGDWWGDAYIDTGNSESAIERYVEEVLPRLPQVAPLGSFMNYNNSAFVTLGRIIEVVTDKRYQDAIEDLVLDPLDLDEATFDRREVLRDPHADGHGAGLEGIVKVTPLFLPASIDPAGGLWTTIDEELEYARFQLGDGSFDGEQS
jgi:CubicO group peptidase (beta-lactamase class C family)